MIFSDRSRIVNDWHKLVKEFVYQQLCGDKTKINIILEAMADFAIENEKNLAKETFLRLEKVIEELFRFLNVDSKEGHIKKHFNFQIAIRCIYNRNFFSQLLN